MDLDFTPIASVSFKTSNQSRKAILDWLTESTVGYWRVIWRVGKYPSTVYFQNKSDAMQFKLTWWQNDSE